MNYLFRYWDSVEKKIQGKFIFLFLDFDGTLSPIVSHPNKAKISIEVKNLLEAISRKSGYKVAIISGRSLDDIKKRVGTRNLIYSGNHGLEVEGPKIKHSPAISEEYKKALKNIKSELKRKLSKVRGILVEDKGLSLSLHFRQVRRNEINFIKTVFSEVTIIPAVANRIKTRAGKKVLEVSPALRWDKGKIVLWLLARQKLILYGKEIIPIYIGDDLTDEDAFKSLKRQGITIFVGKNKPSHAQFYLKNPQEVRDFLERMLGD